MLQNVSRETNKIFLFTTLNTRSSAKLNIGVIDKHGYDTRDN